MAILRKIAPSRPRRMWIIKQHDLQSFQDGFSRHGRNHKKSTICVSVTVTLPAHLWSSFIHRTRVKLATHNFARHLAHVN